jgi:hypothetical protein
MVSAIWLIVLILVPFSEPFSTCGPGDLFAVPGTGTGGPASDIDSGARIDPVSCAVAPARMRPVVLSRAPLPYFLPVPRVGMAAGALVTPTVLYSDCSSSSVLRI